MYLPLLWSEHKLGSMAVEPCVRDTVLDPSLNLPAGKSFCEGPKRSGRCWPKASQRNAAKFFFDLRVGNTLSTACTRFVTTCLAASRPLWIQYFSLMQLRVFFIPSWWTNLCFSHMTNSVKQCFDGRSIECLEGSGKVDWLILPSWWTTLSALMDSGSC